jgi:hypothetical protein
MGSRVRPLKNNWQRPKEKNDGSERELTPGLEIAGVITPSFGKHFPAKPASILKQQQSSG